MPVVTLQRELEENLPPAPQCPSPDVLSAVPTVFGSLDGLLTQPLLQILSARFNPLPYAPSFLSNNHAYLLGKRKPLSRNFSAPCPPLYKPLCSVMGPWNGSLRTKLTFASGFPPAPYSAPGALSLSLTSPVSPLLLAPAL